MRIIIAFLAAGFAVSTVNSIAVFWLTLVVVWVALQVLSPGKCPHCCKYVKLFAGTCHHCGKAVREA